MWYILLEMAIVPALSTVAGVEVEALESRKAKFSGGGCVDPIELVSLDCASPT